MEPEAGGELGSDAELITRVRVGDTAAFGELYRRHVGASAALARQVSRSSAEADDLVSESFARVLDGLKAGGGPDTAFRAYLFTTLRHTAYDRTRKDGRLKFTDDMEAHETPVDAPDPVIAMAENGMVGKAFASLPERWQAVLWHTQVEGMSPAETGVLLGMSANAVTSLAFRAREGLREAYLQAHLAETAQEQCRWTTDRLGAWARGGLSKREQSTVDAHLESCEHCAALAAELTEINSSLRSILAPLLLGGLAAGYLAALGPVGALAQAGAMFGTGSALGTASAGPTIAAAGAAGGAHAAGASGWFSRPWAVVGTGLAAAAVAAVVAVIVATSGGSSPTNSVDVGAATAASSTGAAGAGASGSGANGSGTNGSGSNGSGSNGSGTNGSGSNGSGSNGSGANGSSNGSSTNGSVGSNGTATANGLTSSQTGNAGQSTTAPAGSDVQPGTGDGTDGDGATSPDQGRPAVPEPNAIPPVVVTSTPTNVPNSPQQPTSSAPQQHTSAAATRTSSATTQAPTTRSTSRSTSRPTTPTTRTTPTTPTTRTTPTTPPAPNVSISVGAFTALAGGSITVQVDADNTAGSGASAAGTVVVNAPGVTLGGSATGLRARTALAFAPAVATADCSVAVAATRCSLPAVAAGRALHTSFTLTVGLDARPGSLVVSWGDAFSKTVEFKIQPGIAGIRVTDGDGNTPGPLQVGQPTVIELSAELADGVAAAGPITLPTRSGGIWITQYPDTCSESEGRLTCRPVVDEDDVVTYGPITVTVMPDATTDDSLSVTVPDGEAGIAIVGGNGIGFDLWNPGSGPVDWTGPFVGKTIGAATMFCPKSGISRSDCNGAMVDDTKPAHQSVAPPGGSARLVSARLTWAATASSGTLLKPDLRDTLDWVTVNSATAGVRREPVALQGGRQTCDPVAPCPLIYSADITNYLSGADAVWLDPLHAAARVRSSESWMTPMAAWSLTLVWLDPSADISHVSVNSANLGSLSGSPDLLLVQGQTRSEVELSGVVWAADDWGSKQVVVDGLPTDPVDPINGMDDRNRATGFDLIGLDPQPMQGAVDLRNTPDDGNDQIWVGPVLVIVRSIPDSQLPTS